MDFKCRLFFASLVGGYFVGFRCAGAGEQSVGCPSKNLQRQGLRQYHMYSLELPLCVLRVVVTERSPLTREPWRWPACLSGNTETKQPQGLPEEWAKMLPEGTAVQTTAPSSLSPKHSKRNSHIAAPVRRTDGDERHRERGAVKEGKGREKS